tara:strand:- start:880 stop:999 length:120 start_codon:yes stop_codon:yes gene_type:complete
MHIPALIFQFFLTLVDAIIYGFSTVVGLIIFTIAVGFGN